MIALIDYGMGNLGSVQKALLHVNADVEVTDDRTVLERADGIVLPGVGAFDDCVRGLQDNDLVEPLKCLLADGKPFLGICLGLQVLFDASEEGQLDGLGILAGDVVWFRHDLKIPQIGWNQVKIERETPQFRRIDDRSWFYFVHSYYVKPADDDIIATTTEYGHEFASAVRRDNIFACQYHPEKSQDVGLKLLDNFATIVENETA